MKIIKYKHDKLFRRALAHPKAAREFLDTHLPENFKSKLDLNCIRVENDSFIEETLKESISDVLYSVSAKDGKETFM